MPSDRTRGRIAVFYPYKYLGALSVLRDAARLLAEHDYQVEIYTVHDESIPAPDFENPAISVITDRPGVFRRAGIVWSYPKGGRPYSWLVSNLYRPLWRRLFFRRTFLQRHASRPYACLIGMDVEGLAAAAPLAEFIRAPFVYWSLELEFLDEITSKRQRTDKLREIEYSRRASFTIIQDEWRAQALVEENGLDPTKVLCVPNAPRGRARRSPGNFLRERLNIPPQRKIVLCAGQLGWWAMSEEIMATAASWPEEYVLVYQSRQRLDRSSLKYTDSRKVFILSEPVPGGQYRDLVDSADVGLAFYRPDRPGLPRSKNLEIMGLSSGKLADYLRCGLPVIVNEVTGPRELLNTYKCGLCVPKPSGIEGALRTIFRRYDWYVGNACRCFDERLELEKHFRPVIKRLDRQCQ